MVSKYSTVPLVNKLSLDIAMPSRQIERRKEIEKKVINNPTRCYDGYDIPDNHIGSSDELQPIR